MSRGSTLTLYKKYDLKMDDKSFKDIIRKYAEHNSNNDYSDKKKKESEYAKDIPLIMSANPFRTYSEYDEKTNKWVDTHPKKTIETLKNDVIGYVDSRDKMYCEKMMEWTFGSSFDCLVEKYGIATYSFSGCVIEITKKMASDMLAAINYILGGEWSDSVERGMNNEFIKTFTEGYNCDSYWKYVNRNKNNSSKKTMRFKKDGYDITIKCPVKKNSKNDVNDEDSDYAYEINESNEIIESNLETFRNGLIAFLHSDNWERHDDDVNDDGWLGYNDYDNYKYVLTYEYWG